MKQGINLSLGRKRVDSVLKKVFYVTVGFFALTVVISLSLIGYRLFLKGSYDSLDKKEQLLNSQLLTLQDKKDKLVETKSRIADARKVIAKRAPTVNRIDTISQLVPSTSTVDTISGTNVDMFMTLESEDLAGLNELIEQKVGDLAKDKKRGIKKIEMRSFGLNPKTLKYIISFGVKFI